MLAIEKALDIVLANAGPLGVQPLPLLESAGKVIADDVRSDLDMPPFDKSAMDGYAVIGSDASAAPVELEVIETIAAGMMPTRPVTSGCASKIMTGAPLPDGADAIAIVEDAEPIDGGAKVRILEPAEPGRWICRRGEDIREGEVVVKRGALLRPQEIAVLASVGCCEVKVFKAPRVAVLATGSEIVEPRMKPQPGQIRNSNAYSLQAQVLLEGAVPHPLGIAVDELGELKAKIECGLTDDVLLISGGVSMGEFDLVGQALRDLGVELLFDKVAVKPGKPTVFGRRDDCLVFGLPGNPVSTLVAFECFVAPALRKMMGKRPLQRPTVQAELTAAAGSKMPRRQFLPCRLHFQDGKWLAAPVRSHGSGDMASLTHANGFVVIPEETGPARVGAKLEALPTDCFLPTA